LIEHWFGRPFAFDDLRRVLSFVAAACLGAAASDLAGAMTMTLFHTRAPFWEVWRAWFLSDGVGILMVAPLVIELGQVWRKLPSRARSIEGVGVLSLLALISWQAVTHPTGSWLSFDPDAVVLPLLLWLIARCPPIFGIAGAFVASLTVIYATTFGVGHFGNADVPIVERVSGAQVVITMVTLYTLVLSALFAQRRESETQLAKKGAALTRLHEISSRLWVTRDLREALDEILAGAIELLGADMGALRIWDGARGRLKIEAHRGFKPECFDLFRQISEMGSSSCERALQSGERMLIEDVETDVLFAPFRPLARTAGYRAMQSTPILSRDGMPLGMLATHFRSVHKPAEQDLRLLDVYVRQAADIIERYKAEDALRESEERLRLAQLRTGVGIWDLNLRTGKATSTPELAATFGLEPGRMNSYADFLQRVHPDDIAAVEAKRDEAVRRHETFSIEFRIIRPDGQVRWMLATGGAFYDETTGEPIRILGNNVDITERKRAEQSLAERNIQLALAGRAARVGSYAYDTDTEIMQISEGYVAIHGFPEGTAEIARSECLAGVHPDDKERVGLARSEAFRERRSEYSVEYRIIRPGGEVRWVETRCFISYDGNGHPKRVVGVSIDATDRKQAELRLAERNAQLALAARAALVGSYVYDVTKGTSQVSQGYTTIHGLPEGTTETTISEWRARVYPEDLARAEGLRDEAFVERRKEDNAEYRIVLSNGEVRWIERRGTISYGEDGRPERVIGVNIDVTERKRTELALQASEAKFAGILGIAGDAILSINAKHRITLFNRAAEQLFGYSRAEVLEQPIDLLIPERFRAAHQRHIERFASGPDIARRLGERQEVVGRRRSGEEFPTEASISKLNIGGEWVYTIVLRDITERKRAEERQRVLVSELDHRVKNALATVGAVVAHTNQGNGSTEDFVAALEGRIHSMAMTHELLSSSRWQGIQLTELIRRELAPYTRGNNTQINGPAIILRPEAGQAMAIVLHELATNAAKYGSLSTKSGRVSIGWARRPNGQTTSPLVLEWQEIGGPPVVSPGKSNYGTSTIRELIPYEFGGKVDLVLAAEGVRCRLELPADWLSNEGEPILEKCIDTHSFESKA
jgi:PAS domain S-box-containing protein